jgi:ABC-type bacteriocin/lantibiotic exporter with double-glycine peptidase domain
MPVSLPDVSHFQQTRDGTCLEACACIVLAYLGSPVTEETVLNLFDGDESGTPSSRIRRLERWGYHVIYRTATLADLQYWLAAGLLPILLVQTRFLDYWRGRTRHAVVVVGLNDQTIALHDPAFADAPQVCSLDGFLAAWVEMDEVAAVISQ